jgi:hypothetical protein
MGSILRLHNTSSTGWKRLLQAGTLIPPPLCGEASTKGGGIEREIGDMPWAAVEPTVVGHFVAIGRVRHKGKGRDKWPTSMKVLLSLCYLPFAGKVCYSQVQVRSGRRLLPVRAVAGTGEKSHGPRLESRGLQVPERELGSPNMTRLSSYRQPG